MLNQINWDAVSAISFILLTIAIIWLNCKQHKRMVKLEQMNLKIQTFNKYFEIYSIYRNADFLLSIFDDCIYNLIINNEDCDKYKTDLNECNRKIINLFSQIEILFHEEVHERLIRFQQIIVSHKVLLANIININTNELYRETIEKLQSTNNIYEFYKILKIDMPNSYIYFDVNGYTPKCRHQYNICKSKDLMNLLKRECELYKQNS